ncbi:MAG: bifunctional [glutamine synthetase] adenylyltransferase/[glutamine synthetase]-adenylyl-L-tyrosine phosphorylase, partial [Bauldia sp.]
MAPAKGKAKKASNILAEAIAPRLKPAGVAATKARLSEFTEAAATTLRPDGVAAFPDGTSKAGGFLASVMEYAPFLRSLILAEPGRLFDILNSDPGDRARRLVAATAVSWRGASQAALMATLRRGRQEMALLTALADLAGVWDVPAVTAALTGFADAAVGAAVRFILTEAMSNGAIDLPDPDGPEVGSGWIVLGLGKYGGGELNYSS